MQILTFVDTLLATFRTRGIMQVLTLLQDICFPLTLFRANLRIFLSELHYTMLLTRGNPPGLDLLHVFYGTLILLLIRATLKATFSCSLPGYSVSWHHVIPDTTFEIGTACVLYQPMLLVLEASGLTFGECLEELAAEVLVPHFQKRRYRPHYEKAAALADIQDPMNAPLSAHLTFFFEQFCSSQGG